MQTRFLTLLTLFFATTLSAQDANFLASGKNVLKLNIAALALKNVSGQYERVVGNKVSIAATVRYMPTGSLPLKKLLVRMADNAEAERQMNNLKIGNWAVIPELRFYLSKQGAPNGFYVAPFVSIARYNATLMFEYDDAATIKTIPMTGDVSTVTGGVMIGAQWKLTRGLYLDWWMAGPNYGTSDGELIGSRKLDARDQQLVREGLSELDPPITKFTYIVDENGATVRFKGPWAGIRSGLCIGINF